MIRAFGLAGILLAAFASPGTAASVRISDKSTALPGLAQATIEILVGAGLPVRKAGADRFAVEVKNFHCDRRSNAMLDATDPLAGLATLKCRINAPNEQGTTGGQPFAEGRAFLELLQKIEDKNSNVHFTDCAMGGYCGVFAKSVACTINIKIENYSNGGRWECAYGDGQ